MNIIERLESISTQDLIKMLYEYDVYFNLRDYGSQYRSGIYRLTSDLKEYDEDICIDDVAAKIKNIVATRRNIKS